MTHKNHTNRIGPKAPKQLQEIPPVASKSEREHQSIAAIDDLSIEQLEALVHACGMEKDPEVMRNLECIRKGAKVEALESAISENRDPTIEEVEAAVREIGMQSDSEMVCRLERLRDMQKIKKAGDLIIEAYALLGDLQKKGGEMEIEAVQGFLEMAELGIDGLGECSERSTVSVAEAKISWPVMMEGFGTGALQIAQSDLKKIKLGSRNSSTVRINAVITAASRHKFVATLLYSIVRSNFDLMCLSRTAQDQPIRMARLKRDLKTKSKMLKRLLKGYEANEWREEDRQKLVDKMEALHGCPEITTTSFNNWFAACVALLDCITQSKFYLPRYKLHNLGNARAMKREGTSGKKNSDYRDGIIKALRSALKTVLKVNREKMG